MKNNRTFSETAPETEPSETINATEDEHDNPEIQSSYSMDEIMQMVKETKGEEVQDAKPYGIGIDTASKFIDVTVLVKVKDKCMSYYRRWTSDWKSVVTAKAWAVGVIESFSDPNIHLHDEQGNVMNDFHYCIESTANYHKIVLYAWNGSPSIINPSIAGATKKKTDIMDSRLMSLADMTGVWASSFIPSIEIEAARALHAEYVFSSRMCSRISNRINSKLLQFGFNVSIAGSVTGNPDVREIVMNLISDNPTPNNNLCVNELPKQVRILIRKMYEEYDSYNELADKYFDDLVRMVKGMYWETGNETLSGDKMLEILCTAPGIGISTAVLWLIQIVTPRRFHSAKAVAAYCGVDPSLKISADKVTSRKRRGGNIRLHAGLCVSALALIRARGEQFGRWGANIESRTGKKKKAMNAVARKLAVALYYMMLNGEDFTYEKYSMCREIKVIDIPIEEFSKHTPGFKRYVKIMIERGVNTTQQMVDAYNMCLFNGVKGIGQKFYDIVKNFIEHQKEFVKYYEEHYEDEGGIDDAQDIR